MDSDSPLAFFVGGAALLLRSGDSFSLFGLGMDFSGDFDFSKGFSKTIQDTYHDI